MNELIICHLYKIFYLFNSWEKNLKIILKYGVKELDIYYYYYLILQILYKLIKL